MSTGTTLTLERGKALVLVGQKSSGTTSLARLITKGLGTVAETDVSVLADEVQTLAVLNRRPKAWIIDGLPLRIDAQARLKSLISSPQVQMRGPNGQRTTLPTPHIIFCTGDLTPLGSTGDRRFTVVSVDVGGLMQ